MLSPTVSDGKWSGEGFIDNAEIDNLNLSSLMQHVLKFALRQYFLKITLLPEETLLRVHINITCINIYSYINIVNIVY